MVSRAVGRWTLLLEWLCRSALLSELPCTRYMSMLMCYTECTLYVYHVTRGPAQVLLKVRVKEASVYQMSLFLSLLGAFSTVAFWPFVLALQYTNVEKIHGHNIVIPWQYICASSALAVVFHFSINFGVAYAYPLFISLGTVLGIPLNGVVDLLVRNANLFTTWKFTATDLIVTGFLLMLLPPRDSRWVQRTCCCSCSCCSCCCCDRQWRMSSSPCVNK